MFSHILGSQLAIPTTTHYSNVKNFSISGFSHITAWKFSP